MGYVSGDRYHISLVVSATAVRVGCSITLSWKAVGMDANVASVHLTSSVADDPRMIEGVPPQGSREVIFTHSGTFTFTLTVTFGDGAKRMRRVSVTVLEEQEDVDSEREQLC
jgi:hypothetical protein